MAANCVNMNVNQKIRVGLVEDQFLFRQGMKAILAGFPEIEVVFESADGYSVIEKLHQYSLPDVMLVDLSLPGNDGKEYSGLDLTRDLHKKFPEIRMLILSAHKEEVFIARLIEQGAHGYLVKDSSADEVRAAITSVFLKGSYINEMTLHALQSNMRRRLKPKIDSIDITRREVDVLQLTCQQLTAEEIAERLFISVKTVNGHRNNLLQKTGSRNMAGLVIYAIKHGLVELT